MSMNDFQRDLFEAHNDHRKHHGAPPLIWDDELALHAQEWADQLALEEHLHHAPPELRSSDGENIALSARKILLFNSHLVWFSGVRNSHTIHVQESGIKELITISMIFTHYRSSYAGPVICL